MFAFSVARLRVLRDVDGTYFCCVMLDFVIASCSLDEAT